MENDETRAISESCSGGQNVWVFHFGKDKSTAMLGASTWNDTKLSKGRKRFEGICTTV